MMSRMFASWAAEPGIALLIGVLIRSTVVLLCAGLIVRVFSRRVSAATRGLILFCALCALLLLPVVSPFAPAWPPQAG